LQLSLFVFNLVCFASLQYGYLSGKSRPLRLDICASSSRLWQDDAPHVAGTVITVTLLAYLTFGMRVYTRITRRSWGMEDWMMTLAAVSPTLLLTNYTCCQYLTRSVSICRIVDSMSSCLVQRPRHTCRDLEPAREREIHPARSICEYQTTCNGGIPYILIYFGSGSSCSRYSTAPPSSRSSSALLSCW
jgi:hypothetical protein